MADVREQYRITERHASRLLGQWRGSQRYLPTQRPDEDGLTRAIIKLASEYDRYGYRRITALLRSAGWAVGKDREKMLDALQCLAQRTRALEPSMKRRSQRRREGELRAEIRNPGSDHGRAYGGGR